MLDKIIVVALFLTAIYISRHSDIGSTALIIVDVQTCFTTGTLAVQDAVNVLPVINTLRTQHGEAFDLVVLTQDWHCPKHISFASFHPGKKVLDQIELHYNRDHQVCRTDATQHIKEAVPCKPEEIMISMNQTLWPDHCIIDTKDADFSPKLVHKDSDIVVRKGYNCLIDSYSGFFDNGKFTSTELNDVLKRHHVKKVYVTGIALDFCVKYTSLDAAALGYDTYLIKDAARSTNPANDEKVYQDLKNAGVHIISSDYFNA